MKNEMPSLLLDEKICFLKWLPPHTLQNFWAGHYGLGWHCQVTQGA